MRASSFRDGAQNGTVHNRPDLLVGIDNITDLMGYPMIDRLETEFLLPEDIERKYGSIKRATWFARSPDGSHRVTQIALDREDPIFTSAQGIILSARAPACMIAALRPTEVSASGLAQIAHRLPPLRGANASIYDDPEEDRHDCRNTIRSGFHY